METTLGENMEISEKHWSMNIGHMLVQTLQSAPWPKFPFILSILDCWRDKQYKHDTM